MVGLLCLLFDLQVTAGHEVVRSKKPKKQNKKNPKTKTEKTFIPRSPDPGIHKMFSISALHKYFLYVYITEQRENIF